MKTAVLLSTILSILIGSTWMKRDMDAMLNGIMPSTFASINTVTHNRGQETIFSTTNTIQNLSINPDSVISSDVVSIWHNVTSSSICIRLKRGSRCPRPSLVGRLSGKSVAMLEWSTVKQLNSSDTVHCGSYSNAWIDRGIYFVELMIIHCNGFGVMALDDDARWEDWLEYNFTDECLEDMFRNSLAANETYVWIPHDYKGSGDLAKGRWVLRDKYKANHINYMPPQWLSRRQPKDCRPDLYEYDITIPDQCIAPMDNSHVDRYEFQWRGNEQLWISEHLERMKANIGLELEPLEDNYLKEYIRGYHHKMMSFVFLMKLKANIGLELEPLEDNYLKEFRYGYNHEIMSNVANSMNFSMVCLLGDSHSWFMLHTLYNFGFGHRFLYFRVHWTDPGDILKLIRNSYHQHNCKSFVIGVGSWSIGARSERAFVNQREKNPLKRRPALFEKFYEDMARIVSDKSIYELGNDVQVYLRNIYHIPLSDRTSICDAKEDLLSKDWRTNTVIDSYNYLIGKVVNEA